MTKSVTIVGIVGIASFCSAMAEAGFALCNAGETPVTITGVRASCGCTAAAAGEGGDA